MIVINFVLINSLFWVKLQFFENLGYYLFLCKMLIIKFLILCKRKFKVKIISGLNGILAH